MRMNTMNENMKLLLKKLSEDEALSAVSSESAEY